MNRYYGIVGLELPDTEIRPGVFIPTRVEEHYYGTIYRNRSQRDASSDTINDDITIEVSISIIGDDFLHNNSHYIKYVEWNNTFWEVKSVEPKYPRLELTIGGIYNGKRCSN